MPRTGMFDRVQPLFRESKQGLERGAWLVRAADRDTIARLMPSLDALAQVQATLRAVDRGPLVRAGVAALGACARGSEGRLAWLLLGVAHTLEPVLHPAPPPSGSTTQAAEKQLADAEQVLLRLRSLLRLARACQIAHP